MALEIGRPGIDIFDPQRPYEPLLLSLRWTAVYTGGGSDPGPIESLAYAVGLEGGTGPSGADLGTLPGMLSLLGDTDSWEVTFHFLQHDIPCRILWESDEVDGLGNHVTDSDFIDVIPGVEATVEFGASEASGDEAYFKNVAFTAVFAPFLGDPDA